MTRTQRLKRFLKAFEGSMYRFNTKGAKFYGATFYSTTGWDGAFEWFEEDVKKWDYQINLSTGVISRKGKEVDLMEPIKF